MTQPFKKGDVLFRQGDPSDWVLRISRGDVEILREVGDASVLLGHVRDGEWLGEMGVMENRSRSATARAAADGVAETMSAQQFVDQVSTDPALARELIVRLSIRLRRIEDKVAGDLLPAPHERATDGPDGAPSDAVIGEGAAISLAAQTSVLRARIGAAPIEITSLPYVVGRKPVAGETEPVTPANLMIDDKEPFRLSRDHFMILRSGDRLFVSDLGSTLGTIVNGQAIGHHFMRDSTRLRRGDNHVIAGGLGSPFEFLISVR